MTSLRSGRRPVAGKAMPTCSASGRSTRLHELDGELRSGRRAALQPGLTTPTARVGRHTVRCMRRSAFKMDLGREPANLVIGARYEETKVEPRTASRADGADLAGRQRLPGGRPDVGNETLSRGRQLQQPAAEPRLRHRAHRFDEGTFLVQQDDRACRLQQSVGGHDPGHARWLDAERLHASAAAEQPGAVAARVRQLRHVARVLLLGQGLRSPVVPEERREFHRQLVETINLYGIRDQTGGPARRRPRGIGGAAGRRETIRRCSP